MLYAGLFSYFASLMQQELAMHIAAQARAVKVVLRAAPEAERQRIASNISTADVRVKKQLMPMTPFGHATEFVSVPPSLVDQLAQALGRQVDSHMMIDDDGQTRLSVAVPVESQIWWLTFPFNRPSLLWAAVPPLLIVIAAALALLFSVRLISRPLSRLSQDLLARRCDLRPLDEPSDESVELVGVIRSFNALVSAVEQAAKSRRTLLAGVSHDLRTPLARLRLRVEIECPEDAMKRLEADFLAVERIIDQFLAYAQGQGGVAIGQMHPIAGLVEDVVGRYRTEGLDVEIIRAEVDDLHVPDLAIQRALINLVDNARAHGRGPIQIEVWSQFHELMVVVYDHGTGIAECDLQNAFKPFVQLGPPHRGQSHCGLGLSIVAQVAEQMGGRTVHMAFDGRRSGLGFALPR